MSQLQMNHANTSQPGEDRASFMARIHAALGRAHTAAPDRPPPMVDDATVRLAKAEDDLPAVFEKNAAASGMIVERLSTGGLTARLASLLDELQARRVVIGAGSLPAALSLPDTLRRRGVQVIDWAATSGLGAQFDVDAGITDVHAALAETGTLICCSDAGHSRGLSLVPPIHIAIVRKSDIVPDMLDYMAMHRGKASAELPSSIAMITGPSKTADIEGVLVTGVHGPEKVYVLVVEDA